MSLAVLLSALFAAWLLSLLCARLGVPDVLAFGALGAVGGAGALGLWHLSLTAAPVQTAVALGAAVLLYDSGRGMHLDSVRSGWRGLGLLVTWGVFLTAGLTALAAHLLFHWPWDWDLLLGATVSSTDPAAVISVLRQIPLAPRVSHIAQAESALNDATGSMLTVILAAVLVGSRPGLGFVAGSFALLAVGGAVVGAGIGVVATALLVRLRALQPAREGGHDQQFLELLTAVGAVALSDQIGVSAFVAAFVAGVVCGVMLPDDEQAAGTAPFRSLLAFLARLVVFLILGATLNLGALAQGPMRTLLLGAGFVLLIRPLAVLTSLLPDRVGRWTRQETALLAWVRETGAIPAALAAYLVATGAPGAQVIETEVAGLILITVLSQGLSTRAVARRLGLLVEEAGPGLRETAAGQVPP